MNEGFSFLKEDRLVVEILQKKPAFEAPLKSQRTVAT